MLHGRAHTEISQHGKVHGLSTADSWKSITFAAKYNIYLCCSEQPTSRHPLNSYRLMQETPDLLCMFLVLLISLLILKFLQTFQNARCEHEKQLPLHTPYRKATSSSPSQECYNHWQLAPGFTHKPELLKKHVPDIGSLFIPTALQLVQHLVVRMGMCTPTYRQGCCTQPRVETDRRTHPVFSFHSHLCSSGAT